LTLPVNLNSAYKVLVSLKLTAAAQQSAAAPNASIVDGLQAFMTTIIDKINDFGEKTDLVLRTTAHIVFREFNAYDKMTQTSAGNNDEKQRELRTAFYDHCGITDGPNDVERAQAVCLLTGRAGKLKLAHILPASADEDIKRTLQISDIDLWSFRNVLLLAVNIEMAFDRNKLSFVPNPLRENTYVLKIWDDSVKNTLIWDGAEISKEEDDNTIGYYEDKPLNLLKGNGDYLMPFKRCLSYQNFICYFISNHSEIEVPDDFASALGYPDGWKTKRNDLILMRATLDKAILSEASEDI
jgi:HNH endonuclease